MPRTGLDIVNEIKQGGHDVAAGRGHARIVVTSTGEDPPPFFLVVDTGYIREQFIAEMIEMLFGRRRDGSPHTWNRGTLNEPV